VIGQMMMSGLSPPSALWTPAKLTETIAWYVADDPANTVSGGTTTVLADKGSGGFNAAAVRGGAVMTDTLNGRATLRTTAEGGGVFASFDGGAAIASGAGAVSFFVVHRLIDRNGATWPAICATAFGHTGNTLQVALMRSEVGTEWPEGSISLRTRPFNGAPGLEIGSAGNFGTDWHLIEGTRRFSHDDGFIRLGGAQIAAAVMDSDPVTAVGDMTLVVGNYSTEAGDFWVQNIAEVVAVRDDLSDLDRERLEGYLAWQWGLQAALISGHPFKSAPPLV
jgi:hypothetical protein